MALSSNLHIKTCLFDEESSTIRHIREAVFQQEQGIDPALEWDGLDQKSVHLVAQLGGEPIGVARLREMSDPSGLKLERLAILKTYRGQGIGSEMVYTAIAYSQAQHYSQVVLHAQAATRRFYEQLGFTVVGEPFDEAGILHQKMEHRL